MRWLVYILLLWTLNGTAQSGYNAYALHKLTAPQLSDLATQVEQGLNYRFGGQEYTAHNPQLNTNDLLWFMELAGAGKTALAAPIAYQGFHNTYEALNASSEVTYGNEHWFDLEKWSYIKRDFITYIFNRRDYYRRGAKRHLVEAQKFKQYMASHGHDVTVIINVPLPQNRNLSAFLEEVGRTSWVTKVDVHIYGKAGESDYMGKLDRWLRMIQSFGWEVLIGEFNGVDLKRYPNMKNSITQKQYTEAILTLLVSKGIDEVYFFTLVATESMMNWSNPPIYHRYLVGDHVTDQLTNVFP